LKNSEPQNAMKKDLKKKPDSQNLIIDLAY